MCSIWRHSSTGQGRRSEVVRKTDDQHGPPPQLIDCIAAAFIIMALSYGPVVTRLLLRAATVAS
jgi:hypothetical protein